MSNKGLTRLSICTFGWGASLTAVYDANAFYTGVAIASSLLFGFLSVYYYEKPSLSKRILIFGYAFSMFCIGVFFADLFTKTPSLMTDKIGLVFFIVNCIYCFRRMNRK